MKLTKFCKLTLLCKWVLILMLLPIPCSATTYYVSKERGDNSNNGTSWNTPFESVGKADSTLSAGDMVLIAPGTYYDTHLFLPTGGTSETWTTYADSLQGADLDGWTTILSGGTIIGGWSAADEANLWQAYYDDGGAYPFLLRQNDSLVRPVYRSDGIGGITGAGWFFYDAAAESVFCWFNGGADPDTITELVISNKPTVNIASGASRDYLKFIHLDLRDGSNEAVIFYNNNSSPISWWEINYCHIHFGCSQNGENGGLMYLMAEGPAQNNFHHDINIHACSLGHCANEPTGSGGDPFNFGHCLTPYTSMDVVVDSTDFYGPFGHAVYWKTNIPTTGNMTNKCLKFCKFFNGTLAIESLNAVDRDSVYGCYFYDCDWAFYVNTSSCHPSNCTYQGKHFFCYNTIYNMAGDGLVLWDNNRDFMGVDNTFKHNIVSDMPVVDRIFTVEYLPDSAFHFDIDSNLYYDCEDEFGVFGSGGSCDCTNWAGWTNCFDQNGSFNTENPDFTNEGARDFSRTDWTEHDSIQLSGQWFYTEGAWQPASGDPPEEEPRPNRNKNSLGGGLIQ